MSMRYSAAYAVVFIRLCPVPRVAISSSIKSIARKCSYIEMGSIVDSTSAAAAAATVREKAITAAEKARETTRRSAGHRAGIYIVLGLFVETTLVSGSSSSLI